MASVLNLILFSHEEIKKHQKSRYWLFLSILFLFLSIDESAAIHDNFTSVYIYLTERDLIPTIMETHQWLFFGVIFVIVIGFILIPFLTQLPRTTLTFFTISGIIFLLGAVGTEYIGSLLLKERIVNSRQDLPFLLNIVLEEGLEMYGIALYNCALYREINIRKIHIAFSSSN